jgi:hypothetical protein
MCCASLLETVTEKSATAVLLTGGPFKPAFGLSGDLSKRRRTMKYICLGYYEPAKLTAMTEDERNAMFDECFEYNDYLRANGHCIFEEALQPPETALTLYWKNGKVAMTDGPFTETKEQIGGLGVLEARDMNHAIQLVSQHPSLKYGTSWEIRPAGDMSEIIQASEERRRKGAAR